jgi:DNA polymerase
MRAAPPPPIPRAGDRLIAGLGHSTVLADLDFETYSEAGYAWDEQANKWTGPPGAPKGKRGLGVVGAAAYATHPSTEVLSLYYDLKRGEGRKFWKPGLPLPHDLFAHVAAGGLLEAHNSGFEHWTWNHVCVPKYGWPRLPQERLRCSMAKARAHGLPGALGELGKVLAIQHQKDADGDRLLKKFSMPRNPTKTDARRRIRPEEDATDGPRLYAYNERDIVAESEASAMVPDMMPLELQYWLTDQRINCRGVQLDMAAVHAAIAIIEQAQARYNVEFERLTGIDSPSKLQQFKGWLAAHGVYVDSLDEDAIDEVMGRPDLPEVVRRPLELRALVGSASVKKVFSMRLRATSAGRIHDMYNFHGARTGRPTGEGVQSTNLPKAGPDVHRCGCGRHFGGHRPTCPWCGADRPAGKPGEWTPEAMFDAIDVVSAGSLDWLEAFFGEAMLTLAGCLRGFFIAKPGCTLVSSDFTAIEGVVVACLAGETWRVQAYAEGAPMYLLSAERMFGVSVEEMLLYAKKNGHHHHLRQKGKGGELGLGFGGWVNALRQFGVDGTDDELKDTILKWRAASPAVVHFWGGQFIRDGYGSKRPHMHGLEGMAIMAVRNPGTEYPVDRLDGTPTGVSFRVHANVLYMRLPSGRTIDYHRPQVRPHSDSWRGLELTFEGWNSNAKKGAMGWMRMQLYGGLIAENAVQATARDIQMNAIENCERDGYPVVMHTYDEIVAEVEQGSVEQLEALMTTLPDWAQGWPIKAAGGWIGTRYRKG